VNNLIKEVEAVYSTSHGYIDFQDDTLTIRKQLVAEFCQTVIDKKLKLHWRWNNRPFHRQGSLQQASGFKDHLN